MLSPRQATASPPDRRSLRQPLDPVTGYNVVAADYEGWHWQTFWRRNEHPLVISALQPFRRGLDIGCGTGAYMRSLKRLGEVTGIDPSPEMLRQARLKLRWGAELRLGTTASLPVDANRYDLCLSARSLCHEANLEAAIREVARVATVGGTWVITDVHSEHPYPCTRIPVAGRGDVFIETHKRTPEKLAQVACSTGLWRLAHAQSYTWHDLLWQPKSTEFARIDRRGVRPVFFILRLVRMANPAANPA
ncbi:MAG: class I SAM-dependent methyltransferase [Myxococcales bacterium]|nr:class I SAM-dependent methyltransferase [Myxococcales bacterium]MDD9970419.1 class I SAM-dependent methyltransferase [Myxococcales bacterium]